MKQLLADLLGSAVYAIGALALTGVGAFAELAGINALSAGFSPLGVWYVAVGGVALAMAYKLTTDKVISFS